MPALLWADGIDEDASDFLRHSMVVLGSAASSAYELAKLLRPFLRFCRSRGRHWRSVDDGLLVIWREHLRRSSGVSAARVNASLGAAFSFLRWAEETGRSRFQVGIYEAVDTPDEIRSFPVSAKRVTAGKGSRRRSSGWTTPLLVRTSGARPRHTPTECETQSLHQRATATRHGERNSLMLSWAEETGARRGDLGRLLTSHMPTLDEVADLIDLNGAHEIVIVRKGGVEKALSADPHLILRTIDHIANERRAVVKAMRGKPGYVEPAEIFLSESTGLPLHLDSITSLTRAFFREAGVKRASLHRLRAKKCVEVVEALVEALLDDKPGTTTNPAFAETILVKAAEMMGHASTESLRPYLTYVMSRRLRTSEAVRGLSAATQARQRLLHADAVAGRLADLPQLADAARLIRRGDAAGAAALLSAVVDRLVQS